MTSVSLAQALSGAGNESAADCAYTAGVVAAASTQQAKKGEFVSFIDRDPVA
jgi:hypothetical protein